VSVSSQTRAIPITRLVGICHRKTLAQQTATNDGRFDCSNRNRTARALFLERQKHLLQREELHVEEAICIELQRRRSSSKQAYLWNCREAAEFHEFRALFRVFLRDCGMQRERERERERECGSVWEALHWVSSSLRTGFGFVTLGR
jgi:hypothetical protein